MSSFISAFVITKNEEKNIEKCLTSLTWADEIVVVDAESTDKTVSVAKKFTDKVFTRPWKGFSDQRNFALSQCSHSWVFFLDADEICSEKLIEWFKKFKASEEKAVEKDVLEYRGFHPRGSPQTSRVDMYSIRRFEHFRGRLYKYGADNPSHQWRFFRKEGAHFVGEVHEYVDFEGDVKILEAPILHFPPGDLTTMMEKTNLYTDLDAERLYHTGARHGVAYMFFSGLSMFLKSYFHKRGYRDGVLGFIFAVMNGTVFFLRQAKLYLKLNNKA